MKALVSQRNGPRYPSLSASAPTRHVWEVGEDIWVTRIFTDVELNHVTDPARLTDYAGYLARAWAGRMGLVVLDVQVHRRPFTRETFIHYLIGRERSPMHWFKCDRCDAPTYCAIRGCRGDHARVCPRCQEPAPNKEKT